MTNLVLFSLILAGIIFFQPSITGAQPRVLERPSVTRPTATTQTTSSRCDKIEAAFNRSQINAESCKQIISAAKESNCKTLFEKKQFQYFVDKCRALATGSGASTKPAVNTTSADEVPSVPAGVYTVIARKKSTTTIDSSNQTGATSTQSSTGTSGSSAQTTNASTTGSNSNASVGAATDTSVVSTTQNNASTETNASEESQVNLRECNRLAHLLSTPSGTGNNCKNIVAKANQLNCLALTSNSIFQNAEKNCHKPEH